MTLRFLTSGESHGPELAVIVEGLPAGVAVDPEEIDRDLRRRQGGYGRGARSTKIERDRAEITGGVEGGRTTGAPVGMRIVNLDFANQPEQPKPLTAPRPGHADLAGAIKYGHDDFRTVRERASARETAARVAAGSTAKALLLAFGTRVGSFVTQVGDVAAELPPLDELDVPALERLAALAENDDLRCPDPDASARMHVAIDDAKGSGETLGGTVVAFAVGVLPGLGSYAQWDRKLDGRLTGAVVSIPGIKGAEIGPASDVARRVGTQAQDDIVPRGDKVARPTNRAGGLEAGVTNGEPVVVRAAMKPLSSVRAEMTSVDFRTGRATNPPHVRSDVTAVPAAAVVAEAMVAWVIAGAMCERFGHDRLDAMLAACRAVADSGRPAQEPT